MKELTEEQVREMRARNARKGKVEQPPFLTDEDEKLLDAALRDAHAEAKQARAKGPLSAKSRE